MYQSPNTPLLFKVIGASSLGLLAIFVVFGFLMPKKEIPAQKFSVQGMVTREQEHIKVQEVECNDLQLRDWVGKEVIVEGTRQEETCTVTHIQEIIKKEKPTVFNSFRIEQRESPVVVIRNAQFDGQYRYEVQNEGALATLQFYNQTGIPLVTITRAKNVAALEKVISENFSVGHESIVTIGGIAYVRQEIIALQGNEVGIRTIPGNNCKKDTQCPLVVTQLQAPMSPENLAAYEEILSHLTFVESGEGLVKFQSVLANGKIVAFHSVPGAIKKETDEGVEVLHNDTLLARVKPVTTLPPKNSNTTSFTIGEREFLVYTDNQATYYVTSNTTTIMVEVFHDDGLLTALSLR